MVDDKGVVVSKTSTKWPEVYDQQHPVVPAMYGFTNLSHFVVTNTKGADGQIENVDQGQYWNTNALEDGGSTSANYAGRADATNNGKARFKDGDYEIHIAMSDLRGPVDRTAGKLRVVNFTRTAATGKGGAAANQGLNDILYSPSNAPWVPAFLPEPVLADTSTIYTVGDVIGARGTQYYPGSTINAYIVPHKPGKWNDGDDITTNYVAWESVEADENGVVPLTKVWESAALGKYDLILDYDNDLKFSWKLDGLTGFEVKPLAKIGDRVWLDLFVWSPSPTPPSPLPMGDGVQGDDEPGLEGVVVHLLNADGEVVASATTDPGGGYQFADVEPGRYGVKFVLPPDVVGDNYYRVHAFTIRDAGPDDLDSDADAGGLTDWFTVDLGEDNTSIDAGIVIVAHDPPATKVGPNHTADAEPDAGTDGPAASVGVAPAAPRLVGDDRTLVRYAPGASDAAAPRHAPAPAALAAATEGPLVQGAVTRARPPATQRTVAPRWPDELLLPGDFDLHPIRVGSP